MHTSDLILSLAVLVSAVPGCCHRPIVDMANNRPVISIEERPTMFRVISRRSGKEMTPGIDIYADGRSLVHTLTGEEVEWVLQRSEVSELLDFFDRQGLFSISNESIERAIAREQVRVVVCDANQTRLAARTRTKSVELSGYALDVLADRYPAATELQTIQRCIHKVFEATGNLWQ